MSRLMQRTFIQIPSLGPGRYEIPALSQDAELWT
jgi:hypothetical protein